MASQIHNSYFMIHNSPRGQGLMETIVALGVIMTGLISVISLTIANLTGERETAMRYQAANLAREGIELTRNMRDSNWLSGEDTFQSMPAGENIPVQFNPETYEFAFAGGEWSSDDARVTQCTDGTYTQPDSFICDKPTPFSRTISLAFKSCAEEFSGDEFGGLCEAVGGSSTIVALEVSSTVTWNDGAKSITISDKLYDWR